MGSDLGEVDKLTDLAELDICAAFVLPARSMGSQGLWGQVSTLDTLINFGVF
jgi:hypothetical protein